MFPVCLVCCAWLRRDQRLDVERLRTTGDPQQPGQQECLTSLLPFAIRGARQVIPLCTAVNVTSTDSVYADRRNECAVSGQRQDTVNIVDKATTSASIYEDTRCRMAVRCLEAASQRAVCDATVQTKDCTCMWYGDQSGFGFVDRAHGGDCATAHGEHTVH